MDRADDLVDHSARLRLLAAYALLAANFALLMLPPAVAALVLVGTVR